MKHSNHVEQLSRQVVQAFASDPFVSEISFFGSFASRTHDDYSDVDVHVVSQHFDATMSHLWHLLFAPGPVLVAYPLEASPGYAAYMVLFETYPLYTKLDINIADAKRSLPFSGTRCVYRKDVLPPHTPSTFLPALFEEPLMTLYGYYLGAIRYMKYRKREMHFSAYKFYRAQLDHLLSQWYQESNPQHTADRLGILDYQALDASKESTYWKRYLYPNNEQTMDRLYLELLQTMTQGHQASLDEKHQRVFQTILAFLVQEAEERARPR